MTATILPFRRPYICPVSEALAAQRLAELEFERACAALTARCDALVGMLEGQRVEIEDLLASVPGGVL